MPHITRIKVPRSSAINLRIITYFQSAAVRQCRVAVPVSAPEMPRRARTASHMRPQMHAAILIPTQPQDLRPPNGCAAARRARRGRFRPRRPANGDDHVHFGRADACEFIPAFRTQTFRRIAQGVQQLDGLRMHFSGGFGPGRPCANAVRGAKTIQDRLKQNRTGGISGA